MAPTSEVQAIAVKQSALNEQNREEAKEAHSEAVKFGGNYLNVKDETCPPYTPFYVMVSGHIQSGTMNNHDGISCKFELLAGTDWQLFAVSFTAHHHIDW